MSSQSMSPWTVVHQALLTMGFLRKECWSGLPFPSPGDLSDQNRVSCIAGGFFIAEPLEKPEPPVQVKKNKKSFN